VSKTTSSDRSSKVAKKTKPEAHPEQGRPTKSWSRVAVDANFFILAFAHDIQSLNRFKEIADRVAFKLYTSSQILQELRGRLRRQVRKVVQVIDVTQEELDAYIDKARDIVDRIPQAPDLSLLMVLKKLNENRLISSDFQLLQSLRNLEPEIEGLMGSAFLLHLLERSHENAEDTAFLETLRERVLHTEIKYSITRRSVYDPTTRIKLIESQAFQVVRSLRGPRIAEEDLIGMTDQEALGLLTFLQELRRNYASYVNKIQEQNYREALEEIGVDREELYNHLVLLSWELSATAHRRLLRQITPDMVLLNYLTALCYLYLGEQDDLEKAQEAIEECNRILLSVRPDATTYRRLMVMTHMLRITINLILEDFESATMYFTIFARKTQEWGFASEQSTAQALYLALLVIRGEITSKEFPSITDPEEVIRFLIDLSSIYFALRRFDEAWNLLYQVLLIIQYFELFEVLEPVIQRLILVYYAEGRRRKDEFDVISKGLRSWLQEYNQQTPLVDDLDAELAETVIPTSDYFTEQSLPSDKLHPDLQEWLTVIDRVDTVLLQGSILICRSRKLMWNIALLIQGVLQEERAKGGEQVRLGEGKFKVDDPPPSLKERYRILALIHSDPTGSSRIYVRGGEGLRLLQLGTLLDDRIS
jgi:predicted nucleic acid-binding protein